MSDAPVIEAVIEEKKIEQIIEKAEIKEIIAEVKKIEEEAQKIVQEKCTTSCYPSNEEDKELEKEIITKLKTIDPLQTKVKCFLLNQYLLEDK